MESMLVAVQAVLTGKSFIAGNFMKIYAKGENNPGIISYNIQLSTNLSYQPSFPSYVLY